MSRQANTITIEPPGYATDTERMEITGFTCPYCCGRGKWADQIGYNEYKENTCKVCKGAKKIKALVTIGWKPDFKEDSL